MLKLGHRRADQLGVAVARDHGGDLGLRRWAGNRRHHELAVPHGDDEGVVGRQPRQRVRRLIERARGASDQRRSAGERAAGEAIKLRVVSGERAILKGASAPDRLSSRVLREPLAAASYSEYLAKANWDVRAHTVKSAVATAGGLRP